MYKDLLGALLPNFVKKCAFYRFKTPGFVKDVRIVASVFAHKQSALSWWKPCFMAKCASIDLTREASLGLSLVSGHCS